MSQVRPATADDIPGLVELRGLLFAGLAGGWGPPTTGEGWQEACAGTLARELGTGALRVMVIDGEPDGEPGPAACGMGAVDRRLPSPYNASGLVGHVFGVVTAPPYTAGAATRGRRGAVAVPRPRLRGAPRPGDAAKPLSRPGTVAGWKHGV